MDKFLFNCDFQEFYLLEESNIYLIYKQIKFKL